MEFHGIPWNAVENTFCVFLVFLVHFAIFAEALSCEKRGRMVMPACPPTNSLARTTPKVVMPWSQNCSCF